MIQLWIGGASYFHGEKMRILVVHHTQSHFETFASICCTLRLRHDVTAYSTCRDVRGRDEFCRLLGLNSLGPGAHFDLIFIVTLDVIPVEADFGPEVWQAMQTTPLVGILHRGGTSRRLGEFSLFPGQEFSLLPCLIDLPQDGGGELASRKVNFLIQGYIDARKRSYDIVTTIAQQAHAVVHLVGAVTDGTVFDSSAVVLHSELSELGFHSCCQSCDFILPMIDPVQQKDYFNYIFTTSVTIGLAHTLPFIAHSSLFDLYPLVGLAYDDDQGLRRCLLAAAAMTDTEHKSMQTELKQRRDQHVEAALDMIELAVSRGNMSSLAALRASFGIGQIRFDNDNAAILSLHPVSSRK